MSNNMLTTKEATLVADLLNYEENACKKARLYSRTLLDEELSKAFIKLADCHQRHFNELFELL